MQLAVRSLVQQRRQWPERGEPELAAVACALDGRWGIGSSAVTDAERAFATAHTLPKTHAAIAVANGSVAIMLALEALDIGCGDSVIVPALTWVATASAVLDVNAVPVLIDVTRDSWALDVDLVAAYLRECKASGRVLPRAVIAVHLYQRAADLDRLEAVCRQYGIWLIEDCAHAHGGEWRGQPLGTIGAISTFSFQSSKTITCGEGGMVVTGVPHLEQRLRALLDCGRVHATTIDASVAASEATAWWRTQVSHHQTVERFRAVTPLGSNNRLPALSAALLTAQAARFPEQHRRRANGLAACSAALLAVDGVAVPTTQPQLTSPLAYKLGFIPVGPRWAGLHPALIRRTLSRLLGGYVVDAPYHPLASSPSGRAPQLYRPSSKRRHDLDSSYRDLVDPAGFSAPVAHEIHERAVMVEHTFLSEQNAADVLIEALAWLADHAPQLATDA